MAEKKEVKRKTVQFETSSIPVKETTILFNVDVNELEGAIDHSSLSDEQKKFTRNELHLNPTFRRWMWNQHLRLLDWQEFVVEKHLKESKKLDEAVIQFVDTIMMRFTKPTFKTQVNPVVKSS